jgi:Protein of unknown function (DUF1580)
MQVLDEIRSGKSLGLSGVAGMFPVRGGRSLNPSTIYRWITLGVKLPGGARLRLEAVRVGHRLLTSMPAVERFIAANTAGRCGQVRRAADAAEAELDRLGV